MMTPVMQSAALMVDSEHLAEALQHLGALNEHLTAWAFTQDTDNQGYVTLYHPLGRAVPTGGFPAVIPAATLECLVGEDMHAFRSMHVNECDSLGQIFPDVGRLVLRRAMNEKGQSVIIVFGVCMSAAHLLEAVAKETGVQQLVHGLDNQLLQFQLAAVRNNLESQLDEVRAVKEKLMPDVGYQVNGAHYAVYYRPYRGGGGDFFDIVDLQQARKRRGEPGSDVAWAVNIVDGAGHGPGAAVEIAMFDAILRTYNGGPGTGPGDVLNYVNRHIFTRQLRGRFLTAFLASYDSAKSTLRYASAGHPTALVKPGHGKTGCRRLEDYTGIPLGVEQEHTWETGIAEFKKDDMIVLYTDGIVEARSPSGAQFGLDGVENAVCRSRATDADLLLSDVIAALTAHSCGRRLQDDSTIVIVQATH